VEVATNYTLFGTDMHSWAGQTAELDFTVLAGRPHMITITLFSIPLSSLISPFPSPTFSASPHWALCSFAATSFAHDDDEEVETCRLSN